MTLSLKELARAIPLVAAAVAADEAQAAQNLSCTGGAATGPYYDPCEQFDGWLEFSLQSSGAIPTDGVLVLQGLWRGAPPAPETIALTVTSDDVPVAGAAEATQFPGVYVWRPDAPWTAGATVTIGGGATNAGADGTCLLDVVSVMGEVTIAAEPGGALTPVDIDAALMVELVPTISLSTLACCPGVTPTLFEGGCSGGDSVDFDPSQCAPFAGTGFLQLTLTGTPASTGPVDQQIVYVLKADGQADSASSAPMFGLGGLTMPQCAAIDAIDLGTGTSVPGVKECFGGDVAGQLGPQMLDPTEKLSCAPQVCAVDEFGAQWDLEMCAPYGGGGGPTGGPTEGGGEDSTGGEGTGGQDGEKGCGCAASASAGAPGADGGAPLLGLAGLVWLGRRRRVPVLRDRRA